MYAVTDLKDKFTYLYKDKIGVAGHLNCHYSTISRNLDKQGFYLKGDLLVCNTKSYKSNRGNPLF